LLPVIPIQIVMPVRFLRFSRIVRERIDPAIRDHQWFSERIS